MNKLQRAAPILTLFTITYGIIWWFFGKFFTDPNGWMFGRSGDGLKNYFNPTHYIKYGEGHWTHAITYPYGEHLLFTDSFFCLTYFLNLVDNHIFPIHEYTVGIINFFLIFSIGFCALFVYLILRYYKLPTWYSVISALIICFLSPQIGRFIAHYSLSLPVFFPMVWYFLLRFLENTNRLKWGTLIALTIMFFGFLHPYYLPLGVLFLFTYAGVYSLQHLFSLKQHIPQIISIFAIGLIPFVIYTIYMIFTDPVTDRHPSPYGMFTYNTTFEGVFMPYRNPVKGFLDNFFFIKRAKTMEGYSYVGFIGFICLLLTAVRLLTKVGKGKIKSAFQLLINKQLVGFLWTGFLLFFLAMGTPFIYLDFLLEWIPTLKQFRSLGRFAWVLYYTFTVYTAYYFYLVYKSLAIRGAKAIGMWMLFFVFFFWGLEAFLHTKYYTEKVHIQGMRNTIFTSENTFYSEVLEENGFSPSDFQAILGFPYVNNGSEKFYIVRSGVSLLEMMRCSYDTGIPLATFESPRTSISNAIDLVQLLSSEYIEKRILKNLNDKPILLIERKQKEKPHKDGARLLKKAELFYEDKKVKLYKAPLSVFNTNHNEVREKYDHLKDHLYKGNDYLSSVYSPSIIINRFEDSPYDISMRGDGALHSGEEQRVTLYEDKIKYDSTTVWMEVSLWMYIDKNFASFPKLYYEEYDQKGKMVQQHVYNPKLNTEVYEDWAKATIYFKQYHVENKVLLYVREEQPLSKNHIGDDLLIRPANIDVYYDVKPDGSFVINNYTIPPK